MPKGEQEFIGKKAVGESLHRIIFKNGKLGFTFVESYRQASSGL